MRVIHTADWHIGQTLNGWTRESEHQAFLKDLADLAEAQEADALVVAGDVFDGINPSADAMRMLYEALLNLHTRRPNLTTVLVAGNHDPAFRLEAPAALLRTINAHVVGVMHQRDGAIDIERHLIALKDGAGEIGAHVLAIPFLRSADLPGADHGEGIPTGSPIVAATRRLYAKAVDAARSRIGASALIATGHLHCSGALESEGAERRILVGGEHAVPHDIFPGDLAYVALGHLHKQQAVGRDSIRYSGSPFPLSATELSYNHGVSVLELGSQSAHVEHIAMRRWVPCVRIPAFGAIAVRDLAAAVEAQAFDKDAPQDSRPFVHVVAAPEPSSAGIPAEVERILEAYPVRCASVKILRPERVDVEASEPLAMLSDCVPADLFARAFEAKHGIPPGPEHSAAFHEAAGD